MRRPLLLLALCALASSLALRAGPVAADTPSDPIAGAYAKHLSNVQVESSGVVAKVLKDDNDGSRHQRLIVRLASGQTILIAHNIDLAPRIEGVREGAPISFFGEYEWNNKGGLVHWTHRDPSGRHRAGWIRYGGRTYQ
jgi:hypothetical protein